MNCPRCNVSLLISETQGIEMKCCPQCRGIWLERERPNKVLEGLIQPKEYRGYNPHNHQHDALDLMQAGNGKNAVKDWFG